MAQRDVKLRAERVQLLVTDGERAVKMVVGALLSKSQSNFD